MGIGARRSGGAGIFSGIELFFRATLLYIARTPHARLVGIDRLFGCFDHHRAIGW